MAKHLGEAVQLVSGGGGGAGSVLFGHGIDAQAENGASHGASADQGHFAECIVLPALPVCSSNCAARFSMGRAARWITRIVPSSRVERTAQVADFLKYSLSFVAAAGSAGGGHGVAGAYLSPVDFISASPLPYTVI